MRNLNRKATAPDDGGWHNYPGSALEAYRPWMMETGSLTARIQRFCSITEPFAVQRLRQEWAAPCPDESLALGLIHGRFTEIREVVLRAGSKAVVFAHTVVMGRSGRALARVGGRSLGSVLFSDPKVVAGPHHYRALDTRHPLYHRTLPWCGGNRPIRLWARRALFRRGRACLLVTEVFLPAILELDAR